MAVTGVVISGIVEGDHVDLVEPAVSGVPNGLTITKAWFTCKVLPTDPDIEAIISKIITTVLNADGQITDSGADGTGALLFLLTPTDTRLIYAATNHTLVFDIQVQLSNDYISTYKIGTISAIQEITLALS